ncbi:MAG: glycosylase/AP lyase, DNA-binding [Lachnospiraceae bacterium]|jgi:formamidopyrimidine-DNA glycosylase|nr:glycosylase/AP lyase, DNA-binding [Lachnospiraceae bacterium]
MIELVEARVLAEQANKTIRGKKIKNVITEKSPHKFAFYHGDPQNYKELLKGKIVGEATAYGGQLEIEVEDARLLFGDGVSLQYHETNAKHPLKHQLLVEFDDDSALTGSVQMYGGLSCFKEGEFDNPYYFVAKEKPSPLTDSFNELYFKDVLSAQGMEKLSTKAFLATEQRIPGLGNGVLQDILYNAGIHPKRKIKTLTEIEMKNLFASIKSTLAEMIEKGGRDTEKDLFGQYGKYQTKLSKNTLGTTCPICKNIIQKEAYLGGSIYYCSGCQAYEQ